MQEFLFYLFAVFTLGFGFLVVANPWSRNPVTSALFLVLALVCLAGLFVLLHAYFLAAVQVLVYAGAVMVLFLFVIMLLDLKEEERRNLKRAGVVAAAGMVGAIAILLIQALGEVSVNSTFPRHPMDGGTGPLGMILFTDYLLPFEIVSVLLLVAMIGVVYLSKKDLK